MSTSFEKIAAFATKSEYVSGSPFGIIVSHVFLSNGQRVGQASQCPYEIARAKYAGPSTGFTDGFYKTLFC
jgi:hypothetical protein